MSESALDLTVRYREEELAIFNDVEKVVTTSIEEGNPLIAAEFADGLRRIAQLQGQALAHLLAKMEEAWLPIFVGEYGYEGDFIDFAFTEIGVAVATTKKYVKMWRAVFESSDTTPTQKKKLHEKDMKTLLLLTGGAGEGDFSKDDWKEIVKAPNRSEVREVIRKARGEVTSSKSRLVIMMERDGSLKARRGEDGYKDFGYLNLELAEKDTDIQMAINRLLRSAGIVER